MSEGFSVHKKSNGKDKFLVFKDNTQSENPVLLRACITTVANLRKGCSIGYFHAIDCKTSEAIKVDPKRVAEAVAKNIINLLEKIFDFLKETKKIKEDDTLTFPIDGYDISLSNDQDIKEGLKITEWNFYVPESFKKRLRRNLINQLASDGRFKPADASAKEMKEIKKVSNEIEELITYFYRKYNAQKRKIIVCGEYSPVFNELFRIVFNFQ